MFLRLLVIISLLVVMVSSQEYEETLSDLLVACNAYQSEVNFKNRSSHPCEKKDPDGEFSYFITPMTARFSKRDFLCVLFFKDEFSTLNFKLLFSHPKFTVDAYGIRFKKPVERVFESNVLFELSVMVILSDKSSPSLEILEWQLNGIEMCPACGELKQATGLISGGTETKADQWPWHVSLWKRAGTASNYICGGSIVNRKWIISAAHCMYSSGQIVNENVLNIRIGREKQLSSSYKQYSVSTLLIHEKYNHETFENDIALIKLKDSLNLSDNIRTICFSQLINLPQAARGFAVGYGSTDQQMGYSEVLRQAEMPIVEPEDCLDSDTEYFGTFLFPGNFCAGEIGMMKGVCSGDSGGGFYVLINGNWYLQGITSNTKKSNNAQNPTCNFASYALFTNVTFYTGWINDKIVMN